MLRRVEISGYKSLVDVKIDLGPLVVLFGPNAAGKSNFLDALQLLSRIATSQTLKEAFEPPYRGKPLESFSFGSGGIPELLARESATFAIQADIELSPQVVEAVNRQVRQMRQPGNGAGSKPAAAHATVPVIHEHYLRYRIEVEVLPSSGILRVTDEYLAALNSRGEATKKRKPFLERMHNRLHLRMEGQAHPTYFDRYLDHSILSKPLYPPHYPHLTAVRKELESWMFYYFEPRERMRANTAVKEIRHIGLMGEELSAFLNSLKATNPRQFRGIEKALQLLIPSITGIDVGVNSLGEVELRLREGERLIPARVVSEGTLRVLGLLAIGSSSESPGLVGFEEPETGVHPRRIRLIAERLHSHTSSGGNQLIVTTHSTLLTDLMPNEALYVCRKQDGRTTIEPYEDAFPLGRTAEIERAMDAEEVSVSTRILRGDLDD
jgi:predicted ATPase